jgi:hypothetical protein
MQNVEKVADCRRLPRSFRQFHPVTISRDELVFHLSRVKSGKSSDWERLATVRSLNSETALQAAAS